ncbi:rod shape-determining protein RodA, partial [Aliarcobacter butzleri]
MLMLFVGYGILFLVGDNWKIWFTIFIVIDVSSPFIYIYLIKDYQKNSIHDFIVAEKLSYHCQKTIIA